MQSAKYIAMLLYCGKKEDSLQGWSLHISCGINNCIAREQKKERETGREKGGLPWTKMVKGSWKCRTLWVVWREINKNGVSTLLT